MNIHFFADTEANEEQQSDLKTPANDVTEAVSQDVGGGMEPITEEEPPSDEIVHSTVDESPRLPPERIDTRSPTDTAAAGQHFLFLFFIRRIFL